MAVLKIKTAGSATLKRKALAIDEIDENIKKLSEDMIDTLKAAHGLGLAAPQVGKSLRMIIVDEGYLEFDRLSDEEKDKTTPKCNPVVMINPEIIEKSGEYESEEGCLSVPNFRAVVDRASYVKVKYTDFEGNIKYTEGDGLAATCYQHEIDHLNGVLYIDYLSILKRRMAIKKVNNFLKRIKEDGAEDEAENSLYG